MRRDAAGRPLRHATALLLGQHPGQEALSFADALDFHRDRIDSRRGVTRCCRGDAERRPSMKPSARVARSRARAHATANPIDVTNSATDDIKNTSAA